EAAETANAFLVVRDAIFTVLVRPDIDADDAALGRTLHGTRQRRLVPLIVEAHAVDDRPILDQAKDSWRRIARLRFWRQRAAFDKAKAKLQESVRDLGILVVACGHSKRVREIQPCHRDRKPRRGRRRGTQGQTQFQGSNRKTMGLLCVKREEERAANLIVEAHSGSTGNSCWPSAPNGRGLTQATASQGIDA